MPLRPSARKRRRGRGGVGGGHARRLGHRLHGPLEGPMLAGPVPILSSPAALASTIKDRRSRCFHGNNDNHVTQKHVLSLTLSLTLSLPLPLRIGYRYHYHYYYYYYYYYYCTCRLTLIGETWVVAAGLKAPTGHDVTSALN